MFLYINNKISEEEIKKTIPFIIASKTIGINVFKEVKNLYTENCKIWMKKLKKSQINGKISLIHGLEEIILLKCPYYPKPFNAVIKIPIVLFTEIEKS